MNPRKTGAASALTLAIFASIVAATNLGVAVVAKSSEGPAPVVTTAADPTARLLEAVRNGSLEPIAARAELARIVPALAAVASDDSDPRQSDAIVALGMAGTEEACVALRSIVENASPADAEIAAAALASASHACAIP